jgi:hypothetical protein
MEPRQEHRGDQQMQAQVVKIGQRPQWSRGKDTAVTAMRKRAV